MNSCEAWQWRVRKAKHAGLQGDGDGGLPTMDTEFLAGILNVKIDGALRQPQYHAHLPARLALSSPLQARQLPFGQRLHALPSVASLY